MPTTQSEVETIGYVTQARLWLQSNGALFKTETIRLNQGGVINEYRLNWVEAKTYNYQGWEYLRVPFGRFSDSTLYSGYHIVFRKYGQNGDIAANYKQYAPLQNSQAPFGLLYAENIYDLDGRLLVAVGHRTGDRRWIIDTTSIKKAQTTLSMSCTQLTFSYTSVSCTGSSTSYNSVCTLNQHYSYTLFCSGGDPGSWQELPPDENGGGAYDPPPDPCLETQPVAAACSTLAETTEFDNAKAAIESAAIDGNEHAKTFGRDANGNLTVSPTTNGSASSGSVNTSWPGAFADLHNHPNMLGPSAGDLYRIIHVANTHPGYNTRMVVTPDGSVYALVVINQVAANAFVAAHPSVDVGLGPDFSGDIYFEFDKAKDYVIINNGYNSLAADAFGMAHVLEKYNTGVALLKQDASGSFKTQRVAEQIVNGTSTYADNNCP